MATHDNRTVLCSVVFIDIVEYSKKSVEDQMRVKEQLNALLVRALATVPANDRIILDTGDGVAISFLGDPEESLFFGLALRDALATRSDDLLRLRAGINLGPVRLVRDINGQPNIIGDGINVAQRIMSFARVNQLLVSRSFFDVISALSAEYARLFEFEGARTDKHVREHEVYSLGQAPTPQRAARKRPAPVATHARAVLGTIESATIGARTQIMRRPPLATALAVTLILLVAVALRQVLHGVDVKPAAEQALGTPQQAPRLTEPPLTSTRQTLPEPIVEQAPPAKAKIAREPAVEIRPREQPAAVATGTVRLNVLPWGEIHVDGQKIGVTPPLRDIALKPGRHRIEIHNPGFASYLQVVEVNAGEEIRIRHQFR